MIETRSISKRFGRSLAVDDVSISIEKGESVALWGTNGAGKTTLIRCMLGILRYQGSVSIDGIKVSRHGKRARHRVGYVPQELAFHDETRLSNAMLFFAKLRNAPPDRCAALLERVGLAGHERKRVRDLSGGMKQRLALAVALLTDPPFIILDEPTSNLDADGRSEVVETLTSLRNDNKTIVFASHKPDEVAALASRVIVMDKGRVIRDTTPRELWPEMSPVETMRITLSGSSEQDAAQILRSDGHTVHLNGHGLCVAVPRNSNAGPISTLLRANIEVRHFEILQNVTTSSEGTP